MRGSAQHHVAVATKELVQSFYGAFSIEHAYFDGCSNAGRQALMAAMRYPDDFDGVIAGAPALDRRGMSTAAYKNSKAFLGAFIPQRTLAVIDAEVRDHCDEADGVVDGLIQNPAMCSFDPDSLVPHVLTQAQADALTIFIRAARDSRGGLLYTGSSVSDLNAPGGFVPWSESVPPVDPASAQPWGVAAPISWRLADSNIRYLVMRDPNFNANLDWPETEGIVTTEAARLFDRRTRIGNTDRAEKLIPYLRRGHKLLLYHGYSDPVPSPYRTVSFYQDLADLFGGYHHVQKDARLFMVPGMLHCGGGPGPNSFDTLTALENWVEHGVVPEGIVSSRAPGYASRRSSRRCWRSTRVSPTGASYRVEAMFRRPGTSLSQGKLLRTTDRLIDTSRRHWSINREPSLDTPELARTPTERCERCAPSTQHLLRAGPMIFRLPARHSALVRELEAAIRNRFAQRRIHQLMDVELHRVSRVSCHIENSSVHADCVFRAHLHAVSAVHAHSQIDVEANRVLLDVGVGVLPSHNGDALRRTDGLAEHASDAARGSIFPDSEPMAAPESRREQPRLFRVLGRDRRSKMLEPSDAVRRVEKQVPEQVYGRDLQAADDLRHVELFPERQLAPVEHLDGHDNQSMKKTNTAAVTSALTTAIGNSPSQPSRMS
jgi:pimeloyl-ACP methyl ester carboxylesterase